MKATAYLRVSTEAQAKDDRNGYDRQLQVIEDYAQTHDTQITHIYREAWTGTETNRPVFNKMVMDMLLTKDTHCILVESMDRFSRDAVKGFSLISDLLLQKIDLINCSTGESMNDILNGHPMKEIMAKFSLLISEAEKKMISYRLSEGRRAATIKAGGRYVSGMKPRYSPEFKARLKEMKASGQTHQAISDTLNSEHRRTAKKLKWTAARVAAVLNIIIKAEEARPPRRRRLITRKED